MRGLLYFCAGGWVIGAAGRSGALCGLFLIYAPFSPSITFRTDRTTLMNAIWQELTVMTNVILKCLRRRSRDEDGAVTVDWVVLMAAIVALGGVFGGMIGKQTGILGNAIGSFIGSVEVPSANSNG